MDGASWYYYKWDGMVLGMRWMSLGGLRKRAGPNNASRRLLKDLLGLVFGFIL